jgi:hypothetical protein
MRPLPLRQPYRPRPRRSPHRSHAHELGRGCFAVLPSQRDFGEETVSRFVPELFFLRYQKLSGRWFLRPGVRAGYRGMFLVEMPKRVRVEERAPSTAWVSLAS